MSSRLVNATVWLLSLISSDIVHLCVLCEIARLDLDDDAVREAVTAHGRVPPTEPE